MDTSTILQVIVKETLSPNPACAALSLSRVHVEDVFIIGNQVLASQLLHQECNAEIYLEWFC